MYTSPYATYFVIYQDIFMLSRPKMLSEDLVSRLNLLLQEQLHKSLSEDLDYRHKHMLIKQQKKMLSEDLELKLI